MWLKEAHIIVFIPCGKQHFTQWWQWCCECTVALLSPRKSDVREAKEMSDGFLLVKLHHGFKCILCHEHNVKGGYP
jgi:hypothetical protein